MNIVLHQWEVSPFAGKIRRILAIKGLSYSTVNYNGLRAAKAASLTPVGKLPVLDIDGQRYFDSRLIAAELERRFPSPPLVPALVADRAQMEILQDWADESLYWYEVHFRASHDTTWAKMAAHLSEGRPAFERWILSLVGRHKLRVALKAQGLGRQSVEQVQARFWMLMAQLDAMLSGRTWLVGEHLSLADIAVASQLHEVARTTDISQPLAKLPHLRRWLAQV